MTNQRKNIIVTGATGNLGRVVVTHLLSEGHRVIATTFNPVKEDTGAAENLETHQLNLADEQSTSKFVDAVVGKHKNIDAALLLAAAEAGGTDATTGRVLVQR